MAYKTIACVADDSAKAQKAYDSLCAKYKLITDVENADVILALGGDGFMLHTLHKYMDLGKAIYGMNCGTVGFLMNEYREDGLIEAINSAKVAKLIPLRMTVTDTDGQKHEALAINEVSLLRQTRQIANLRIKVDDKTRMNKLMCDGILVATPAGSTAYNLSAQGPIIPIKANILALTPISPFRPRRWRGALLNKNAVISFDVLSADKRPVSAVADFTEVRNVKTVEVREDRSKKLKLLFDSGHSLEERIISEQFAN